MTRRKTSTGPGRKSPGASHRLVVSVPLATWAELVTEAARDNVTVAEAVRRRLAGLAGPAQT